MKLSIITINLNNSPGLEKTILSVFSQTFKDFEFIIIDGKSSDSSTDLILKYQKQLSYWISEEDKGIYEAMNKGIRKAKGEYCLFLNSGDWLYSEKALSDVFSMNLKEDIVYGKQLIEKNGKLVDDPCLDVPYLTFRTLMKSHIPHQATFIKRNLFDKIGLYNEENKIVSDWEFIMLALFKYNCSIRRIYSSINVYDTEGISSKQEYKDLQNEERIRTLQKHFPLIYPDYQYFECFLNKPYIKFILKVKNIISWLRK